MIPCDTSATLDWIQDAVRRRVPSRHFMVFRNEHPSASWCDTYVSGLAMRATVLVNPEFQSSVFELFLMQVTLWNDPVEWLTNRPPTALIVEQDTAFTYLMDRHLTVRTVANAIQRHL